jgi:ketosteroid isomerase-like protein
MSQENVEIVRAGFEAWNAGDMDAVRELLEPDAMIVRGLEGWPEGSQTVGREAIMRFFEQLRETWDVDTFEPVEFIDAGDRVVGRLIWRGTGHGPELRMEFSQVWTLRKGKVFLLEYFWDHAEALETLGLSEQDAHADP